MTVELPGELPRDTVERVGRERLHRIATIGHFEGKRAIMWESGPGAFGPLLGSPRFGVFVVIDGQLHVRLDDGEVVQKEMSV